MLPGMDTPPPLRKQPFLVCLLFNLFALPGLGTWLAGKKTLGLVQLSISLSALTLTAVPVIWLYWSLARQGLFRDLAAGKSLWDAVSNIHFRWGELSGLAVALCGAGLFLANWAWSGFTAKASPPTAPIP
jgi:hypothetical protein